MKNILIKDKKALLTTYKVIKQIMEETEQTKNTGFVYVKNYLANLICDSLEDGEIL